MGMIAPFYTQINSLSYGEHAIGVYPHRSEYSIGQAIPSVTPTVAALHFHKTECFCFTQQKFAAGEGRNMPLRFVVDKDLPKDITTLTLAYTFFDVTQQALAQ